jgi:hypothetical protein
MEGHMSKFAMTIAHATAAVPQLNVERSAEHTLRMFADRCPYRETLRTGRQRQRAALESIQLSHRFHMRSRVMYS